jgi:iron complex transport system substrate-binding protein
MNDSISITDQLGRSIHFETRPTRIVSLVPSITELLIDMGLESEVVGRTLFCIHPERIKQSIPQIGGTKTLKIEQIKALQPTIIIANKEENTMAQIDELTSLFPVYISDIKTIDEAFAFITDMGVLFNQSNQSNAIKQSIQSLLNQLQLMSKPGLKVAYLIWKEPLMAVAGNTYIHALLKHLNWVNVFEQCTERYPQTSVAELNDLEADLVLLSSEPFPFKAKHQEQFSQEGLRAKTVLVNGELYSWYGSRLLHVAEEFTNCIHQINALV